jgi:hypothetical protein
VLDSKTIHKILYKERLSFGVDNNVENIKCESRIATIKRKSY